VVYRPNPGVGCDVHRRLSCYDPRRLLREAAAVHLVVNGARTPRRTRVIAADECISHAALARLRHDQSVTLYLPDRDELRAIAMRAELRNPNPNARMWIRAKIDEPPSDWDERTILTVPGVVWSVSSDTCATGRLSGPENVAYDHYWREFVFRQPRNEAELASIMSADSEEVFACYRFDGLSRWTSRSVGAWMEEMDVVLGYVRWTLSTEPDSEMAIGLRQYETELTSPEFRHYLGEFRRFLDAQT
jgi:hypothetical protein